MHHVRFAYPFRTFSCLSLASILAFSANGCADDKDSDSTGGDTESETTLTGGTDSSMTSTPSDSDSSSSTSDTNSETDDPSGIQWQDCPSGFVSQCAYIPAPLDHNNLDGEQIQLFISRIPAQVQPAKRQLWLLQGGPGGSGEVFADSAQQLATAAPDMDIFVLEHRGVGESTRLGCPDQEASASPGGVAILPEEMAACIAHLKSEWGEGLQAMNTTNAARDLAQVISQTSTPDQKVYVYGVSYGVLWAMRYLQIEPAEVDGVILDSLPAPGAQWLSDYDQQFDPVLFDALKTCADGTECFENMGPDPKARMRSVSDSIAAGHCSELELPREDLQVLSAIMQMIDPLRKHLPPIYHRLERCNADDVEVIKSYFTVLESLLGGNPDEVPRYSPLLQLNIALSEIWESPAPSLAELEDTCNQQILCPFTAVSLGAQYDAWPRYPTDPLAGHWPITSIPVLSMNGDLDPQTPHGTAALVEEHLNGPGQSYIQVPHSPHGVMFASQVKTAGAKPCGMQMALSFLENPSAPIDTSCLSDLAPMDYVDKSQLATLLFGGKDPWGSDDDSTNRATTATPNWTRVIEKLRRAPIELQ